MSKANVSEDKFEHIEEEKTDTVVERNEEHDTEAVLENNEDQDTEILLKGNDDHEAEKSTALTTSDNRPDRPLTHNVSFTLPEKTVIVSKLFEPQIKRKKTKSPIHARTVLWYLTFVGFAVNYMLRINLNITIVDMIYRNKSATNSANPVGIPISECYNDTSILVQQTLQLSEADNNFSMAQDRNNFENISLKSSSKFTLEREFLNFLKFNFNERGFDWNEYEQGLVLGSFYWLHWITQVPGGILARKYGTKIVFGLSNFIGCVICSLIPLASYYDYKVLLVLRVIQGLVTGLSWPAMHHMTAQWIPPDERSKFVSAYLGGSVGIAVFFPLFGYVISWSSWEWVYHVCTIIGIIWYSGWLYFVYDSPAEHPRIDDDEREYIENSLGKSFQSHNAGQTPWKAILTSVPVWISIVAQWGGIWGLFTLMTQAPTYFKIIHGWNIQMTGLLSGLPHFMRMLFSYLFSIVADYLLRSNKMSRTNVRKLAGLFCFIIQGFFIIALAYSGCNSNMAVTYLTLATMVHGAVSAGPLSNFVDVSPNFSGVTLGLSGMIAVLPGFISPVIVGWLTMNNQTIQQWNYVYLISAGMLLVCGVLYVLFADSNEQPWNNYNTISEDKELQNLYSSNILSVAADENAKSTKFKVKQIRE